MWMFTVLKLMLVVTSVFVAQAEKSFLSGEPNRASRVKRGTWDSYIDNLIAHSKDASGAETVDKVAIIGLDGGASWTSQAPANALKVSASEGAAIARAFKSKDFTTFMASGITIEGIKYQFLRDKDGTVVYAKKKDHGGITMQASKTAIVLAHTKEGMSAGLTNAAVATIAGYLESLGM